MSSAAPSAEPKFWRPHHNQWAIAMTVTLATFMEIMDSSVANVSLPHIAGALGADENQATWVITSYLVANAIILPLSSYLSSLMGRKRFYMTCVALFAGSSLLCGLAPTLPLLLFFRVLQAFGLFDLPFVLTSGGPGTSTQSLAILGYNAMFRDLDFGPGAAVAVSTALLVVVGSLVFLKVFRAQVGSEA